MKVVSIVGRPNVGKSTLFNRLIGERKAVVDDRPGVTRDRIYGVVSYHGKRFILVDTGGLVFEEKGIWEEVRRQVDFAVEEADLILFMVDVKEGVHPLDRDIADYLRRKEKEVWVLVNKVDNEKRLTDAEEFHSLGFEKIIPISAIHGYGVKDMLEEITEDIEEKEKEPWGIRIAVVGKPNVGKSSFVNAVLGYERVIVSETPGTTRDAVDSFLEYRGEKIILIDTAGLRRKSRIKEAIEYYTMLRALQAIERGEVVFVMLDAFVPVSRQDKRIISWVEERRRGLIILLNKYDLIPPEKKDEVYNYFRKKLDFIPYAPFIPVSSLTGEGIDTALLSAIELAKRRKQKLPEKKLREVLREAVRKYPPPFYGKKFVKIYRLEEKGPGYFELVVNIPEALSESYLRYLKNRLYEHFDLSGMPVTIKPVKKE